MADLSWSTSWDSVISYNNQILPNNYTMTIGFDIVTDDSDLQNVAFDRIKYFVKNVMQDAIFSSMDDERNAYFQENFKQRIVTFPVQPQDLSVVTALYAKFNSIVEGKLEIESISLSSIQGDNVTIHYDADFAESSTLLTEHDLLKSAEKTPWWFRDDCGSADFFTMNVESNTMVFITDVTEWQGTGLEYPETDTKKKKKKKDARNWSPTIIDGGKTKH